MYDEIMPMTLNIETTHKACIFMEDVRAKEMSHEKMADTTLITSELFRWTRPQTCQFIATTMDQAIKPGFSQNWLMNWIKPIHKGGDKNLVSNYHG